MKIGKLVNISGVRVETIRFYEKAGLMPVPARSANNYRSYNQEHLDRLRLICCCRASGMSLIDIQRVLRWTNNGVAYDELKSLEAHLVTLDDRIAELTELKSFLTGLYLVNRSTTVNCSASRTP